MVVALPGLLLVDKPHGAQVLGLRTLLFRNGGRRPEQQSAHLLVLHLLLWWDVVFPIYGLLPKSGLLARRGFLGAC